MRDEFVYTIPKVSKKTLAKDTIRLSKSLTYKFDLPHLEKNKTFLEIVSPTSKQPMNFLDCQKKIVFSIIEEDKNCPKDIDKEKLAEKILSIALDYGVDPIDIACIVKRESHFHTNAVGGNARGLMQITPIVVKDMFQPGRSELYHEKLKTLNYDGMIHLAYLIAKRGDYSHFDFERRKRIFWAIFYFSPLFNPLAFLL